MARGLARVRALDVSLAALFTALTWLSTIIFTVYIPTTRGFFNIGEVMVYTSALLLKPSLGAFAGGVGSAAADLTLGYSHYAPATLIIKAGEAFIVGYLSRKRFISVSLVRWRLFSVGLSLAVAATVGFMGVSFFSGIAEVTLGPSTGIFAGLGAFGTHRIEVPWAFWATLATVVGTVGVFFGLKVKPEVGWTTAAVLIGGFEMVIGYFLYQAYLILPLFNITGIVAIAEVPWNVTQMLIGLIVSVPLVNTLTKAYPKIQGSGAPS